MIMDRPDWQEKASCRGVPSDVFFPDNPGGQDSVYRQALQFCQQCEVTTQCLEYAMSYEQGQKCRFGMFGGKTPRERYALAHTPSPITIRK